MSIKVEARPWFDIAIRQARAREIDVRAASSQMEKGIQEAQSWKLGFTTNATLDEIVALIGSRISDHTRPGLMPFRTVRKNSDYSNSKYERPDGAGVSHILGTR